MKLKVQRKNYQIKFHHDNFGTECNITDLKGNKIYGIGMTRISPEDQLNRPVGRKYAIARAIQETWPTKDQDYTERKLMRNKRRAFWQAYWAERERITGRKFAA